VRHAPFILVAVLALTACGAEREAVPAGSIESSQPGALPDLARVVCEAEGPPRIETPAVKPRPDGVHIEFVNETGKDMGFSIEDPSEGGMGDNAREGTSTQVVDLHPGTVSIACYDAFTEDAGKAPKTAIKIVDEDDVWIPARLTCTQQFSGYLDYAADARGNADPLEAARDGLSGYMQTGDTVEPAGYPEAQTTLQYRLVRAGEVLAIVELEDAGSGGWLPGSVTGCSSLSR
jgi:hypothetical protein